MAKTHKMPPPPAAPKLNLPRPHKAGDPALDRRDVVASYGGASPKGGRVEIGVTRAQERANFSGKVAAATAAADLKAGQAAHRKRVGGK